MKTFVYLMIINTVILIKLNHSLYLCTGFLLYITAVYVFGYVNGYNDGVKRVKEFTRGLDDFTETVKKGVYNED